MDSANPNSLADRLCQACYHTEHDLVARLLAEGADPNAVNSDGHLPIERSAIVDDPVGVAMLVQAGADPDLSTAPDFMPPLALAAWFGCHDAARALLDCGSDPMAPCRSAGRRAIHYACSEGLAAEALLLAARGGLCLLPDLAGLTALDLALASGSRALCRGLGLAWPMDSLREHIQRWSALDGQGADDFWGGILRSTGRDECSS